MPYIICPYFIVVISPAWSCVLYSRDSRNCCKAQYISCAYSVCIMSNVWILCSLLLPNSTPFYTHSDSAFSATSDVNMVCRCCRAFLLSWQMPPPSSTLNKASRRLLCGETCWKAQNKPMPYTQTPPTLAQTLTQPFYPWQSCQGLLGQLLMHGSHEILRLSCNGWTHGEMPCLWISRSSFWIP